MSGHSSVIDTNDFAVCLNCKTSIIIFLTPTRSSAETELFVMTATIFEEIGENRATSIDADEIFEDTPIRCIDCTQEFVWTAGEQLFFRDKQLQNPPKRCKECKKAKNKRLEAIELARTTGKKQRIEVRAECAKCSVVTTVPFYPCQGRPVYCRDCYAEIDHDLASVANSHI
jgi:CxxC-x17-CxxC domain-containing protein